MKIFKIALFLLVVFFAGIVVGYNFTPKGKKHLQENRPFGWDCRYSSYPLYVLSTNKKQAEYLHAKFNISHFHRSYFGVLTDLNKFSNCLQDLSMLQYDENKKNYKGLKLDNHLYIVSFNDKASINNALKGNVNKIILPNTAIFPVTSGLQAKNSKKQSIINLYRLFEIPNKKLITPVFSPPKNPQAQKNNSPPSTDVKTENDTSAEQENDNTDTNQPERADDK